MGVASASVVELNGIQYMFMGSPIGFNGGYQSAANLTVNLATSTDERNLDS